MVFYLIGLGLGDEKDITVKGLEVVKRCARVYLEHYTAIIGVPLERLEAFYGRKVELADRECVENDSDALLAKAETEDVAFLVVGDVFAATTHCDLLLRAAEKKIPFQVIHNASIMNAVSACGLQLYNFGQCVSICFFSEHWRPDSFYAKVKDNVEKGFHTLCLLDIKVKEQSFENMAKGVMKFEPPRYMTVNQCIEQLLEIEAAKGEGVYTKDSMCVGLARVGQRDQRIVTGTMEELLKIDFGKPLHSVVIPGHLHEIEQRMLDYYHWDSANRQQQSALALQHAEAERTQQREARIQEAKRKKAERKLASQQKKQEDQESCIVAAAVADEDEECDISDFDIFGFDDSEEDVGDKKTKPTAGNKKKKKKGKGKGKVGKKKKKGKSKKSV